MQVGREVHSRREDAFVFLPLTFAEELFPPFSQKMEFRMIIRQNLNLFALFVKFIADHRIDGRQVVVEGGRRTVAFSISTAPPTNLRMFIPATAIGNKPTGVSTE